MRNTPLRSPTAAPGPTSNTHPGDVTLIDASSLHDVCVALGVRTGRERVTINFKQFHGSLTAIRAELGMRRGSKSIVSVALDPGSEPQQRFSGALRAAGFEVDAVDFRDAAVSPRPGGASFGNSVPTTLSSRIAYGLGAQLRHRAPCDVLVVTHDYQTSLAMLDLAGRLQGSRVVLAFWKDFVDPRWAYSGIFTRPDSHVRFHDLSPRSMEIFGFDWLSEEAPSPATSKTSAF